MTHVDLLDILVALQGLRYRLNLLIGQHILEQIQVAQRQDVEQVCESLAADFVVIDVDVVEVSFVLEHLDELLGALIVDIVVGELELFERVALLNELADELAAYRGDFVVRKAESLKTDPLLV